MTATTSSSAADLAPRAAVAWQAPLLYAALLLTPFQDTILRVPLRHLGTSFAAVPILLAVVLDLGLWLANPTKHLRLRWLAAAAYAVLLNAVCLALWGVEWNGTDLVAKTVNLAIMTAIALYVIFRPDWLRLPRLATAVHAAYAIAIAGVLLSDLNLAGLQPLVNNPVFHQTENLDTRWRGFTMEASTLALNLGSLGFLSAALARSRASKIGFIALTVLLLALGASKGAILTMTIVGVLVVLLSRGMRLQAILATALLLPVGFVAYDRFLMMSNAEALSETTTAATRGAVILWSLDVLRHNPLGVGFGGFYPALSAYLPETMDRLDGVSPLPLNFEEVVSYATSAENASTKTLLFNFAAYFGFPFLIAFAAFVFRLVRGCLRARQPILLAAVLFVTIGVSTYNDPLVYYNVFAVYGIAWRLASANPPRPSGVPVPAAPWGARGHLAPAV